MQDCCKLPSKSVYVIGPASRCELMTDARNHVPRRHPSGTVSRARMVEYPSWYRRASLQRCAGFRICGEFSSRFASHTITIGGMATQLKSIAALINEIRGGELALPDLQRDYVWNETQIRTLLDSIMRDYPFGSLLFWNTQFLEVVYRDFTSSFVKGQSFQTSVKSAGQKKRMVLDGQQRLQSLYLAFAGTFDGRRLYFNVTSGPESTAAAADDVGKNYRFEFWGHEESNRAKRLVPVTDIIGWADRYEDEQIDEVVNMVPLEGAEAGLARRNLRLLRRIFTRELVPITVIDEEVIKKEQAKNLNEILDIFDRVNSGGTRLTRSELMFSLIKTKWRGARGHFDTLVRDIQRAGFPQIDNDFVIRGLLTVSDVPIALDTAVIEAHWPVLEANFGKFNAALRTAIDFCRSPDVRILSSSLLDPIGTLLPVIYYLSRQHNASVPDEERRNLRTLIYFLLFNRFLSGRSPEARIRYLRDVLRAHPADKLPLDALLNEVARRQRHHAITTTDEMLDWNPKVTLNIAQPMAAQDTLSWQAKAEVDHIFPRAAFGSQYPELVENIGNFAYLGKLQNIRKSDTEPEHYFEGTTDSDLKHYLLIDERSLLTAQTLGQFVERRRHAILAKVREFLGR